MKKNKIYEETKCTNFRELVSSCSARFGNRTAFTVKKKNKELHNISFIDFENNIAEFGRLLIGNTIFRGTNCQAKCNT